jgi:hypothetical protein
MVSVRSHTIPERNSLGMLAGCRARAVRDHPSASSRELCKERAHVLATRHGFAGTGCFGFVIETARSRTRRTPPLGRGRVRSVLLGGSARLITLVLSTGWCRLVIWEREP